MAAVSPRTWSTFSRFGLLKFGSSSVNGMAQRVLPSSSQLILVRNASSKSGNRERSGIPKGVGAALVTGGVIGGIWAVNEYNKAKMAQVHQIGSESKASDFLLPEVPSFTPARQIRNPADTTGIKITLFQYQTCPFCCKARAFLDYFGFNYDVIEVNSVMRTQVKWSKYKKVPILVAQTPNGQILQLNDSSMIISALMSFLYDQSRGLLDVASCYPQVKFQDDSGAERLDIMNKYFLMFNEAPTGRTKESIVEERRWRRWVDDVLVHTLSPNVYRTPQEALEAFQWFDEVGNWEQHFAAWERWLVMYVGSAAMWIIGKRLKKRHNLKADVRESLYDECNYWVKSIKKKGTPFMGGSKPNLSDLAVFGVLSAIEGTSTFKDLLANTNIGHWFSAMKAVVQNREGQALLAQ